MSKSKSRTEADIPVSQDAEAIQQEAENDGTDSMQSVDRLQEFGINASDISKLKSAGIFTFVVVVRDTHGSTILLICFTAVC